MNRSNGSVLIALSEGREGGLIRILADINVSRTQIISRYSHYKDIQRLGFVLLGTLVRNRHDSTLSSALDC